MEGINHKQENIQIFSLFFNYVSEDAYNLSKYININKLQ